MPKQASSKLVMIRKTDEFSSVFSFRKRYSSEYLIVHYKPNSFEETRVGFVISKKVAKLAVDRNYMRRVLRELCRHERETLRSVDVVIQVKKSFNKSQFLILKQELAILFAKIARQLNKVVDG